MLRIPCEMMPCSLSPCYFFVSCLILCSVKSRFDRHVCYFCESKMAVQLTLDLGCCCSAVVLAECILRSPTRVQHCCHVQSNASVAADGQNT